MQQLDLKKITVREIGMFAATLAVAAGFIFYQFEYEVQDKKLKKIEADLKKVNASVDTFTKELPNAAQISKIKRDIEELKKKNETAQALIKNIKSKMTGNYSTVLMELRREAEQNGAILRSSASSESEVKKGDIVYQEVKMTLKFQSDYFSIGNYIAALEKIPAIISLESLETTRKDEILPHVETSVKISLFVL